MLNDLKQYEDALPLFEKIENYNRQRFGKKDKETFDAMRNVALTLNYLGQHEEAKQAGDLKRAEEYKMTHMNELIYSGKPLCGMKLKAKEDEGATCLTKGKIYELLDTEKKLGETLYSIMDDEEFIPYLYAPEQFEVVEDEEKESFVFYKDTAKVVEFQQIPLCDYNEMKATILEDGTFSISGVDETWKSLGFMTFDDDGYDNDDYDFSYDFTKVGTKKLFALLQDKDPYTVKTDTDLKELLNLGVIQKRFASKEGVDELFEICDKSGIDYTGRNY